MTTKPDRFERMVEKVEYATQDCELIVQASIVSQLLRREHAWMKRMVKQLAKALWKRRNPHLEPTYYHIYQQACDDILQALEARRT